jgi:hypothetical protein
MLRRSHSYVAQRISANPANIALVGAVFTWGLYLSYRDDGPTADLWWATALAAAILAAFTWAYLRFFRAMNAVRIFVTRYGLVYRDRDRILRLPRRTLRSIERLPVGGFGRWCVTSTRGAFEYDGRLVSAIHLSRLIDGWLTDGRWELQSR